MELVRGGYGEGRDGKIWHLMNNCNRRILELYLVVILRNLFCGYPSTKLTLIAITINSSPIKFINIIGLKTTLFSPYHLRTLLVPTPLIQLGNRRELNHWTKAIGCWTFLIAVSFELWAMSHEPSAVNGQQTFVFNRIFVLGINSCRLGEIALRN